MFISFPGKLFKANRVFFKFYLVILLGTSVTTKLIDGRILSMIRLISLKILKKELKVELSPRPWPDRSWYLITIKKFIDLAL